jgi:hypothetical protein
MFVLLRNNHFQFNNVTELGKGQTTCRNLNIVESGVKHHQTTFILEKRHYCILVLDVRSFKELLAACGLSLS